MTSDIVLNPFIPEAEIDSQTMGDVLQTQAYFGIYLNEKC